VIQPLFDLADPNNPIWEQLQQQQEQAAKAASASGGGPGGSSGGMGSGMASILSNLPSTPFKKDLLDYDYGDDEDGGGDSSKTQQQMNNSNNSGGGGEYGQNQQNSNNVGLDTLGSILANPEILRQLATLQEQIAFSSSGGYHHSSQEQERQRKLAELNKQEAAFDQRLAQTVAVSSAKHSYPFFI
jgi:hypothetical protein